MSLCYNVFMKELHKRYDELQLEYGAKDLNSIYGNGCDNNAKVALVFMNPTKKNVASSKDWQGIKAQWLGTKQIWDFLTKCGMFDEELNKKIQNMKSADWTPAFCKEVYKVVENKKVWITNLAKCTQEDARPLPDNVFSAYKDLLKEELIKVNPKKIILFGNQVSSIVLGENISVSQTRKQKFNLKIQNKTYSAYAVYYPVGNGRFNQDKAIVDIKEILS